MVSVLVVVERVVVLIFVEEERKEEGTRYEGTKDFSSKLLLFIPSYKLLI